MTVGGKIGATLFALVFAIAFGGVGAVCAWGMAKVFLDCHRAGDWVLVQARIDDARLDTSRSRRGTNAAKGVYHYTFEGKEYSGRQLGFNAFDGSDNIGDWQANMAAFLDEAKRGGKTIPVYVNPGQPDEAVVDRDVRWALVGFMSVFVLIFGGVGAVALYAIGRIWSDKPARTNAKRGSADPEIAITTNAPVIRSAARSSILGLWFFTFFWNLISFTIAIAMVPELIQDGEFGGLLVLLFPLFGVLMLWGAIAATVSLVRRGKATLALGDAAPRMGGRLGGVVAFSRVAGRAGQEFQVRLVAKRYKGSGERRALTQCWSHDLTVRATADPRGGLRMPFQFDVPASVKGIAPGSEAQIHWSVVVKLPPKGAASDEFTVAIKPALASAGSLTSDEAPEPHDAEPPPPEPTPEERRNEAAMAKIFGQQAARRMTPEQHAAMAQIPPRAQAALGMLWTHASKLHKAFVAVVVLFVVVQIGTFLFSLFAS